MIRYATIYDLEGRGVDVSDEERALAAIDDACTLIDAEMARCGADPDPTDAHMRALRMVACNLAKRALSSSVSPMIDSPYAQQVGGMQDAVTIANPNGDMYLTKTDRRMLGIDGMRATSVSMVPPRKP